MNPVPCDTYRNLAVSHTLVTGSRHRRSRQPCEDVVRIHTTREYLFCGLADGQSGKRYGAEGGRFCLEAVEEYIASAGIENLLKMPFPDELPCAVAKAFRKRLCALAESKAAGIREFASTLLAVAVNRETGNYVLVHLGDGCAISIPHTGDPVLISTPENGITSCYTWLTTSEYAVSHLRVAFGSLESKKRLLLITDGATCFCRGKEIPHRAKELLKNGSPSQLCNRLAESDPVDDAACILLDVCPSVRS